ncbi:MULTISPECIES: triose-phosphate isomerase [Helcobacillus]|uniref:Triosephosphate isomerase n=1 Tax=Helcobacillus massiliensis TaxID=521392 RepID=A0A839QY88_9MICO|nr:MULTISPECIES: triose-phosphate isomerase [Helcobacillus]MBB3022367.1 triosephosphate isomerase [Helcobacillus massiliensis]MCG7426989.1 triose-phosphate isomerase [Helcobacillus sp. ACRRO]MDK7741073.1 triose-phosphate isomerase [Helcobacillus massiliensis]WOO93883.1 triose-phosphate isomerase [Helcobacillus massiliensis]
MTRTPLIAGNWKMNKTHLEAQALVEDLNDALTDHDFDAVDVAVLPPFVDIRTVQTVLDAAKSSIGLGAQDISQHESGAYTGEVSAAMLKALNVTFAAIGHSERRQYHGEDEAITNAKVKAALGAGITPILCVGEPLEVRQAGTHVQHTLDQVRGGLEGLSGDQVADTVIAYEPVWAIGTGEVATPEDAQEVCGAIRGLLSDLHGDDVASRVRVLYGGSVKSSNVADIMAKDDIDGALVGGASLKADEFAALAGNAA